MSCSRYGGVENFRFCATFIFRLFTYVFFLIRTCNSLEKSCANQYLSSTLTSVSIATGLASHALASIAINSLETLRDYPK